MTTVESNHPVAVTSTSPETVVPALIVFGLDGAGKPHASWFGEFDAPLATKAARLMAMTAIAITSDEHRTLASQLPEGRVFASGRGFVPFVKKALYDRLVSLGGPNLAPTLTDLHRAGAGPVPSGSADTQAAEHRPEDWSEIQAGSTVLIHGGGEDGWFEAEVIETKLDDLVSLRWRDWPDLPILVRRHEDIALLNPLSAIKSE